jgi:hypothetical protein
MLRTFTILRFLAGAIVALTAAYAISEAVDPVFPTTRGRIQLLRERGPELRAIAVGNSHNQAVDFEALGHPGLHFWLGGQDVFGAAYLARLAVAEAPGLRYVLMPASPGMHRLDNGLKGPKASRGTRRELYARTSALPLPGSTDLWVSGKLSPIAREDHWRRIFLRAARPLRSVTLHPDGARVRSTPPLLSEAELRASARDRALRHTAVLDESKTLSPDAPLRVMLEIQRLAADLETRGILLVLYTPPYGPGYLDDLGPAVAEETRSMLRAALAGKRSAVWLDFSLAPGFEGPDLFEDGDHLSAAGARMFSSLLRRCLDRLDAGDSLAGACPATGQAPETRPAPRARHGPSPRAIPRR